jgi:hypothetical protein
MEQEQGQGDRYLVPYGRCSYDAGLGYGTRYLSPCPIEKKRERIREYFKPDPKTLWTMARMCGKVLLYYGKKK